MHYPICIEWGNGHTATGIQIPDIPGAATAGDTFEEACVAAAEIAQLLLNEITEGGQPIPMPTSVAGHRTNPAFARMDWGMLEVDITPFLVKT